MWRVFFVFFGWTMCLTSSIPGYHQQPTGGPFVWGYFTPPLVHRVPSKLHQTAMEAMVDLTNNLGIAILQDNSYSKGNFAFSPYGVASVLVVLYEGARGESARQIHSAVGFPSDKDIMRVGFRDIHRHLRSYFSHEGYLSGINLSKDSSHLKTEYKKILRYYGYDIDLNLSPDDEFGNSSMATTVTSTSPITTSLHSISSTQTLLTTLKSITGKGKTTTIKTESTTLQSENTTIRKTENTTTQKMENTTTLKTENTTPRQPESTTTRQPESTTTRQSESTTTRQSENTTPQQSENTTTRKTENTTPRQSESTTTRLSENTTQRPSENTTTQQSETTTTTTEPPENTTTAASPVSEETTQPQTELEEIITTTEVPKSSDVEMDLTLDEDQKEVPKPVPETTTEETSSSTISSTEPEISTVTQETETDNENLDNGMLIPQSGDTEPTTTESTTTTEMPTSTTELMESITKLERSRKSLNGNSAVRMKSEMKISAKKNASPNSIRHIVDTKVPLWLQGNTKKPRTKRTLTDYLKSPVGPDLSLQLQNGMYDTHVSRNAELYRSLPRMLFLVDGAVDTPVPVMTYTNVFQYAYIPRLHAKAMEFPLDDVRYKLLILLPVERRGLRQLIYDLRNYSLNQVLMALWPERVRATVPTFMVEGFVILTSSLQRLGISDVFDPRKANLSGMSLDPDLYVRNVEQSVTVVIRNYVEILDIQTRTMAARQMEHEFEVTHPFLYFVLDTATNVALMAGQILDPLNSRIY